MSNYNGRMGKGYQKVLKGEKRMEAELRNERTKPERRKSARRGN